jgi:hypothetical protein
MSVTFTPRHVEHIEGEFGPEPKVYANFANANCRDLFHAIGLHECDDEGLCGSLEDATLDRAIKGALRALNAKADYSRKAAYSVGANGCQCIECASPDEHMRLRLKSFLKVCMAAKETGDFVIYG